MGGEEGGRAASMRGDADGTGDGGPILLSAGVALQDHLLLPSLLTCPLLPTMLMSDGADLEFLMRTERTSVMAQTSPRRRYTIWSNPLRSGRGRHKDAAKLGQLRGNLSPHGHSGPDSCHSPLSLRIISHSTTCSTSAWVFFYILLYIDHRSSHGSFDYLSIEYRSLPRADPVYVRTALHTGTPSYVLVF
jgi:hypothetical protein